ncbi:TetR/AcrR family transcriptional regulator [Nocardia pseudobrasiliensis]|uniref:TetR family transcriptional regulator n=1 Tax=Nocardia pseudobrasiliensis TaxID=45979 RepID=A0A370I0H2_9NOCA|nr:TetR/AcrR family transcriptional regulator [Nocardia pseudobrasiliensis]RDI64245.1 TetR family transcriptional regulator [Nocardia pseudobrasiliensis]
MGRPQNFDTDSVVEMAMETFWTHGYANTSPARLAECTGIGKGSLYNTFGSKRELFERALARYDQLGAAHAEDILSRPGSTRDRIGALLRFLVDMDLAGPERRGCLAANTAMELAGRDPEMTAIIRRINERMIGVLTNRIEQGLRDGDVRADLRARPTAEFFQNTIGGLRMMAKTYDAPTLYRVIDAALTTL